MRSINTESKPPVSASEPPLSLLHPLSIPMPKAAIRVALVLALCTSACSLPGRPESTSTLTTTDTALDWSVMTLGPNDVLTVTVASYPEYSSPELGWRIDSGGFINLPIVGAVHVADSDVQTAQANITTRYARHLREPSVALSVLQWNAREFYVLGQVQRPGSYTMTRPLSLFAALSEGSGFASGADREHVYLLRPHGAEFEVHEFNGATPDSAGLVTIKPGDILFVRQTGWSTMQEQLLPVVNAFGVTSINLTGSSAHDSIVGN